MAYSKDILGRTIINKFGRELNDPEPKYRNYQEDNGEDHLLKRMRSMVRTEMSNIADKNNMETFEEANDFDIDDDFEVEMEDTRYMREEYVDFSGAPSRSKGESPPIQPIGEGEIVQPRATERVENSEKSSEASQP